MNCRFLLLCVFGVLAMQETSAQTTYDRVYGILQSSCAAYCHNSSNPTGNLLLDGSKQQVMNNLVNVVPDNAVAAAKGYLLVFPGDARRSFLFRKINHGLDANVHLETGEGDPMPKGLPALSLVEREMIRQWIIFGAADTGYTWANEQVITDYYNGFAEQRIAPLPVPDTSEGYQIYYGPIFLEPGVEVEFDGKFHLFNESEVEVYRMNVDMNVESHHLAVFKYHPGQADLVPPGLKKVNNIGDAASLFFSADVVAQWPNPVDIQTPEGTALIWESNAVLNISYHLINYSDSTIAAEVYFNIYTRPRQPNTIPMLSYPVRYDGHPVYQGGWDVFNLVLYPTGTDTTLTIVQYHPDSTFYWNLWSIQAHTHQLGRDYNVYLRNPDGSKGPIIYDGSFDEEYRYDRGFYDWEHPPLRYFDPYDHLRSVDMTAGLIHEAVFNNNTGDTVGFGLKTTDEMFVTYIFYTKSETPVGILPDRVFNSAHVKIYPQPAADGAYIHIGPAVDVKDATFILYNTLGEEVSRKASLQEHRFLMNTSHLKNGCYFFRLLSKGQVAASGKILIQR